MRKTNRYVDTADTLEKLPEFLLACMALADHSQQDVAAKLDIHQSMVSAFINRKGNPSVASAIRFLSYCQEQDPTGRAYRIVQLMNQ